MLNAGSTANFNRGEIVNLVTKSLSRSPRICPSRITALCFLLAICSSVRATPITIDIGPSPNITSQVTTAFSDLNGLHLQGQTLSLDFNFANNNFVRLFTVTNPSFDIFIALQTNGSGVVGFLNGTGSLLDQNGIALGPSDSLGSASGDDGSMSAGLFPLLSGNFAPPLDFYGVHLDLSLPTNLPVSIIGAQFQLVSTGLPHDVFGVGPGVPTDIVPDSGNTLLLLSSAILILLISRRPNFHLA